jgi:protein kinase A
MAETRASFVGQSFDLENTETRKPGKKKKSKKRGKPREAYGDVSPRPLGPIFESEGGAMEELFVVDTTTDDMVPRDEDVVVDVEEASPLEGKLADSFFMDSFDVLQAISASTYTATHLVRFRHVSKERRKVLTIKSISKMGVQLANEYTLINAEIINHLRVQAHPFVQGFYCSFMDRTGVHLVNEFCPGGDLGALIEEAAERGHGMGEASTKHLAAEIALAIEDVHNQGIIFRNMSPESVLIEGDGHARLTGFSLSKRSSNSDRTLTQCGVEDYLAPEIHQNQGYGESVDWWAFGVTLFEMVTGFRPFIAHEGQGDLLAEVIIRNQPHWPPGVNMQALRTTQRGLG